MSIGLVFASTPNGDSTRRASDVLSLSPIDNMALDLELDRRFAWRWLLTVVRGDCVLLLGFDAHEAAFLTRALVHADVTEDARAANVLLVNGLRPECAAGLDFLQLRSLAVVARGNVVSAWHHWMAGRFAHVSNYALLAPTTPRLIVPLGKRDWTIAGLALHRPGRSIARVAMAVLTVLARVGIEQPLRGNMVCIANMDVNLPHHGARLTGLDHSSTNSSQTYALYLGTPDANRKTVILPLNGVRTVILKHGDSPIARAALRNEASALQAMSQTSLAAQVPLLCDVVDRDGSVTLRQEYRSRQRMGSARLNRAAVEFLGELSRQGRCSRPLAEVLSQPGLMSVSEARAQGHAAYARVRDHLDVLAAKRTMIWGHRSHGDFAPWNVSWTTKGFFVFDWEASQTWCEAFCDAFYFVVAPELHVKKRTDPTRTINKALKMAANVAKRGGFEGADLTICFALWILRVCKEHTFYRDMLSEIEIRMRR